uniref:Acidic ribosomal protein P0 n=1 Tax=Rhizophora mucronata TaxID=61149 RepID=A0A2P2KT87_RHIMU
MESESSFCFTEYNLYEFFFFFPFSPFGILKMYGQWKYIPFFGVK